MSLKISIERTGYLCAQMGDTLLTLLSFRETSSRVNAACGYSCTGEKFKALEMIPFSL